MKNNEALLLIFVKNPIFGQVKTRLAKDIGHEKAMEVYQQLLAYTADMAKKLHTDIIVYYSHHIETSDIWDGIARRKEVQDGGGLGERMSNAFRKGFADGYQRVAIIGSDCPEITNEIVNDAFKYLLKKDAVLGRAEDGGYYMLGLSKMRHELFIGKSWSTDTVATDTIADCERLGISLHLLPTLSDIDYIGEWEKFKSRLAPFEKK